MLEVRYKIIAKKKVENVPFKRECEVTVTDCCLHFANLQAQLLAEEIFPGWRIQTKVISTREV